MLLNKDRAFEVMDKYRLDGLVAKEAINVYYLTDYWDLFSSGGWVFNSYGVLPRNENAPAGLVINAAINLERLSEVTPTWVPNIVMFSDYSGRDTNETELNPKNGEPIATEWNGWPIREGSSLTDLEKTWAERARKHSQHMAASPAWGLRRVLKDAGLNKGRIGTDDPRVLQWMQEMELPEIEIVEATNIFREIRMIKSDSEVQLMRKAAIINEQGVEKAITSIYEGAKWSDIEKNYFTEISSLGGNGRYIVTTLGGLPHGKVVAGESLFLDSLADYKHYLGDIGRTLIVGEPSKELFSRAKAMEKGWKAACELIKPGVKRSELIDKTIGVIKKEGFNEYFYVSPHSLGLEHTDDPMPLGPQIYAGGEFDFTLEENMVINIDMPYFELGWGTLHLEDTILVTKHGFEALTSNNSELRIIEK